MTWQPFQYEQDGRIDIPDTLPTGVSGRAIANDFIFGSTASVTTFTVTNGTAVVLSITLTQNQGYTELGNLYFSLYETTVASANEIPFGGSVTAGWTIIGPFFSYDSWNASSFSSSHEYAKIYLGNNTGGDKVVTLYTKWRYVCPRESA